MINQGFSYTKILVGKLCTKARRISCACISISSNFVICLLSLKDAFYAYVTSDDRKILQGQFVQSSVSVCLIIDQEQNQ